MLKSFKLLPLADKILVTIPFAAVTGASIGVASGGYHVARHRCIYRTDLVIERGFTGALFGAGYPIAIPLVTAYYLGVNSGNLARSYETNVAPPS